MSAKNLPEELRNAAHSLGQALRAIPTIQAYLNAQVCLQADAEAIALEKRLYSLYEELLARQQAGEEIPRTKLDEFYALRHQVQTHPSISERDTTLRLVKPYLADIADEISSVLGVDFTSLAKPR